VAGELKRYDVSGKDIGDGRPAPAGTILKLDREAAERLGLEKSRKTAEPDAESKPVRAEAVRTAKRTTAKRSTTRRRR
jgi:hypothetical protein